MMELEKRDQKCIVVGYNYVEGDEINFADTFRSHQNNNIAPNNRNKIVKSSKEDKEWRTKVKTLEVSIRMDKKITISFQRQM